MPASPIITFTTDFGTQDHYVGTMKGVVLSISPTATLVDICHGLPSYNILDAALTIAHAYSHFPPGTVHVIVVDPGVGSTRRPIVAEANGQVFVCPDNGVLSFVCQREHHVVVRHITNARYFLDPVSNTFHGRDIFAPVAAHIASGAALDDLGPPVNDFSMLDLPKVTPNAKGGLDGAVLKIDKFGNIVTNITAADIVETLGSQAPFRVRIAETVVSDLRTTYTGAPAGHIFAIMGSLGYLEIAANQSSAGGLLKVKPGDPVELSKK